MKKYEEKRLSIETISEVCEYIDSRIDSLESERLSYEQSLSEAIQEGNDYDREYYGNQVEKLAYRIKVLQNLIDTLCK